MKIYLKLEKILKKNINFIWVFFIKIHEFKNICKKKKLFKNIKLTSEQKEQIDNFYIKNYGKKVSYKWHRLYQSYTGNFDYMYLPEYIFSTKIELLNNKRMDVMPFEDKSLISTLFSNIDDNLVLPKTYIMRINGIYFDENKNIISEIDAIKKINDLHKEVVIKISKDSSSGRGIQILNVKNNIDIRTNTLLIDIFKKMGKNFIVQEKIIPHAAFKKLYPKSINTLRVITYFTDDNFYVAPIILRIGQGGKEVDNAHAGGMFIGVGDDGKLLSTAFTEYQKRYIEHPDTHVVFKNFQLPNIDDVKRIAIKCHKQLPNIRFISWDFTINENSKVVLVEANLHTQAVWVTQIAHGKAMFGENTAKFLKLISK